MPLTVSPRSSAPDLGGDLGHRFVDARDRRDVRRDRDPRMMPERVRGRQRLLAEHVERRAWPDGRCRARDQVAPRRSASPRPTLTTCAPRGSSAERPGRASPRVSGVDGSSAISIAARQGDRREAVGSGERRDAVEALRRAATSRRAESRGRAATSRRAPPSVPSPSTPTPNACLSPPFARRPARGALLVHVEIDLAEVAQHREHRVLDHLLGHSRVLEPDERNAGRKVGTASNAFDAGAEIEDRPDLRQRGHVLVARPEHDRVVDGGALLRPDVQPGFRQRARERGDPLRRGRIVQVKQDVDPARQRRRVVEVDEVRAFGDAVADGEIDRGHDARAPARRSCAPSSSPRAPSAARRSRRGRRASPAPRRRCPTSAPSGGRRAPLLRRRGRADRGTRSRRRAPGVKTCRSSPARRRRRTNRASPVSTLQRGRRAA